jgi:hypothetical protein
MHLQHQYKKKEDLEIYEMDYISNANLQEVCDLKQPVFFASEHTEHLFSKLHPDLKEEVVVKDIGDYHRSSASSSDASTQITGITLSFSSAYGLMDSDPKHIFYSENNGSFLEEADFIPTFSKFSSKIGSPWSVKTSYDLLFASPKVETPWKFHTASQRFLVTSPGQGIRVKMTPWKSRKYMDLVYDYETFDFWCRSVQESNIKCLDFDLKPGYVLYIPPYWFYSVEFLDKAGSTDSKISFVASFTYTTPMNILANAHHYGNYFLSQSSSVSNSITQTIVPNTRPKKEEKEEETKEVPPIDAAKAESTAVEIQEMLSVIEKPKVPTENQE